MQINSSIYNLHKHVKIIRAYLFEYVDRRRDDDAAADIVFVLTTTCSPLDLMAQIFVE